MGNIKGLWERAGMTPKCAYLAAIRVENGASPAGYRLPKIVPDLRKIAANP